ncbi:hypothetical protein E3N88_28585 [Mikania micrantha]|uniref:Uncharacterized protein n=1 Tax=Mikania micrantha TaxID=192012 RepID=A0A5N6N1G5_9ASTR|nr:hypothetical protein E3N88_28585 [Mikania micrantha]
MTMKSRFILFAHSDVELCVGTSMANGFRFDLRVRVKEKETEKAEKEKEKAEKNAMLERMASIESLLRVVTKNLPSSS